jgi:photosystem II stability/assembly factor-like uncharacterized protein
MKTKLLSLLLFICCSSINSQWNLLQKSSSSNSDFKAIKFIDNKVGFIVGNTGTILKTNDAGVTWIDIQKVTTKNLNSIFFVNSDTGYITGEGGTILITKDCGVNWNIQNSETTNNLQSVYFYDTDNGFIVGDNFTILFTSNGGSKWNTYEKDKWIGLNSVFFSDSCNGYIVGTTTNDSCIYRTVDSGKTWDLLKVVSQNSIPHKIREYLDYSFHLVYFIDTKIGYIAGRVMITEGESGNIVGLLLKTSDGGLNWDVNITNWEDATTKNFDIINSINFVDQENGYGVGYRGINVGSGDGGGFIVKFINGVPQLQSFVETSLNSVYFINKDIGFAIGKGGSIYKTENGGGEVSILTKNLILEKVNFHLNSAQTSISFTEIAEGATVSIYSIHGQLLINSRINNNSLQIAQLSTGVYLLSIKTNTYQKSYKFIKY